jgi:uncharacterized membrane protein SpoIIM required for sporulation
MTRIIIAAVIIAGVAAVEIALERRRYRTETPAERMRRWNREGWPEEGF